MKKLLILTLILISSCQEKSVENDAPLSGIIDQENEKTIIVEKLAQGYVDGKFEIAEAYFTQDGVHRVNDAEYSTEEIIAGYNFHSVLFDNIKHNDPWVTTMIYNNGQVFTNQWARWTGTSKISGEEYQIFFYCAWQWYDDKIIGTSCYFDTTVFENETKLYQEKINPNGLN
tara:strand:+ start:74 stop:589 length:516 start_codon:yes stop_codon:yes gene_type:complete